MCDEQPESSSHDSCRRLSPSLGVVRECSRRLAQASVACSVGLASSRLRPAPPRPRRFPLFPQPRVGVGVSVVACSVVDDDCLYQQERARWLILPHSWQDRVSFHFSVARSACVGAFR